MFIECWLKDMIKNRKYIPDLSRQQANCEANYLRIIKLMPDHESINLREFQVNPTQGNGNYRVRLEVLERFKYTMTLVVTQQGRDSSHWLNGPAVTVRLYHDAKMAEVVDFRRLKQLKAVYEYPNSRMYQTDEKAQLNEFLGEWLSSCLAHGHSSCEFME